MRVARTLWMALVGMVLLTASACTRSADVPPPTSQTPPLPPSLGELVYDHPPERLLAAVADDSAGQRLVRLEAMRLIRRERPADGAPELARRAVHSRSAFEQAVALDALAYAYPSEAGQLLPSVAESFAGDSADLSRLAIVILRYRLEPCYGLAIRSLVHVGDDAVVVARPLIRACGRPIAPALDEAVPSSPTQALLLRLLARQARDGASATDIDHAAEAATDGEAVVAASFPPTVVTAFADTYGANAIPVLRQCLAATSGVGQPEAAVALAELGDTASAADIQGLLEASDQPSRRPGFLRALGRMHYRPALAVLVSACQDQTASVDATGVTSWPIAQAALIGLGEMPGDDASDALRSALTQVDRPAVVVTAAESLARRGQRSDAAVLRTAVIALSKAGAHAHAAAVQVAYERLSGGTGPRRDLIGYVVRYHDGATTYSLITDQPLVAVDTAGRVLASTDDGRDVSQESIALSQADIAQAIQLRNSHRLTQVRFGGEAVDDVDMVAR